MYKFDRRYLREQLNKLCLRKQLGFALLLCERMMPSLRQFSNDTGYSDSLYEKCLKLGWVCILDELTNGELKELADRCFEQAPHTEEFTHALVSAALNAALSIGLLMSFIVDRELDNLEEIASLARDTAHLYVQQINNIKIITSNSRDLLLDDPIMQKELGQQKTDLEFLTSTRGKDAAMFGSIIRKRASAASSIIPPN